MRLCLATAAVAFVAAACCATPVNEGTSSGGATTGGSSTGGLCAAFGQGCEEPWNGNLNCCSGFVCQANGVDTAICVAPTGTSGGASSAGTSGGSSTGGGSTTSGGCAGVGQACGAVPVTPCCDRLSCQPVFNDNFICEPPCQTDTDCGTGNYCDLQLNACHGGLDEVTAGQGYCHRDCFTLGCGCYTDADCPGGSCNLENTPGTCVASLSDCFAPNCSAACPQTSFAESVCPVCLCQSCPAPDAGGPVCGIAPDAGSCSAGQLCCDYSGGTPTPDGGAASWQECTSLGPDGGCPPGALCTTDGNGSLATCSFYYD
ncbi:MAG TPA: hypothetical protein VMB50_01890 [Myxococcales bacterium]|nr:hypothetical protein [Myxococcales bacterium]